MTTSAPQRWTSPGFAECGCLPANRLAALARYGLAAKAPALRDLAEPRRTATLLATARHLEAAAVDDALSAVAVVEELVPDDAAEDAATREALTAPYGVVRPFLELLAEALPLGAAPAGEKLLAEVRRLPDLTRRRVRARHLSRDEVTASLVPAAWQRAVYRNPDLPPDVADRLRPVLR